MSTSTTFYRPPPGIFMDGRFQPGASRRTLHAPYDKKHIAEVDFADAGILEQALSIAVAAEPKMAALTAAQRREILVRIAQGIESKNEILATWISQEAGKPIRLARGEVARAAATFSFAAEETWRHAEAIDLGAAANGKGRYGLVRRFPVGLVAAISPFNFPLNLVAHKLAPAFAAGCPVVLKPASQTPMSALCLAEICNDAGLPKGALSVLPMERGCADALVTDPRVKILSFTGSPDVGWDMKARAGKKKVVLELGGNAAVLVQKSSDLKAAAMRVAAGAFAYAGQVCISVQRIFVQRDVYLAFQKELRTAIRDIQSGNPADENVLCGPLIDDKNAERVSRWIDEAKNAGARLLCGGKRVGNVIEPVLLENVPKDLSISCQEAFGPVSTIEAYDTLDEGIDAVNDSKYGLQAGIFTDSIQDVWRAYEKLNVGGVIHNDVPTFRVDHMPYGGIKESGFGREGLAYAFEDYTEPKLLALSPLGIPN